MSVFVLGGFILLKCQSSEKFKEQKPRQQDSTTANTLPYLFYLCVYVCLCMSLTHLVFLKHVKLNYRQSSLNNFSMPPLKARAFFYLPTIPPSHFIKLKIVPLNLLIISHIQMSLFVQDIKGHNVENLVDMLLESLENYKVSVHFVLFEETKTYRKSHNLDLS